MTKSGWTPKSKGIRVKADAIRQSMDRPKTVDGWPEVVKSKE